MRYKVVYVKDKTYKILTKLKMKLGSYDNAIVFLITQVYGGVDGLDEYVLGKSQRQESEDKEYRDAGQHIEDRVRIVVR